MKIGEVIKGLLKSRNITQLELADKIGKSKTAISQMINGAYSPSPDTLEKISEVLNVPIAIMYLLTISPDDVPDDKKEVYRVLSPLLEKYLLEIFGINKLDGRF